MVPRLGEYSLRGDVVFRRGRQPTCRDSSGRDQEQTPQPLSSHPTSYPTGSPWTRESVLAVHPGQPLPARGHVKEG